MRKVFLGLATCLALFSCKNAPKEAGTYEGTFPCADCDGTKVELTLNGDNTYTLVEVAKGETFTSNGKYTVDAKGLVSLDAVDFPNKFQITGDQATALTVEGGQIMESPTRYELPTKGNLYQGTLPCADCEGIKTELVVFQDNTYVLSSEYITTKENPGKEVSKGNLVERENGVMELENKDGVLNKFKVNGDGITVLDMEGKEVKGATAKFYAFKKVGDSYFGKLPCADCEGVETTLLLKGDNTYVLTEKYLGGKGEEFVNTGNYTKDGNNVITLSGIKEGEGSNKFLMEEDTVTMLDLDGKKITTPSTQYNLTKKK